LRRAGDGVVEVVANAWSFKVVLPLHRNTPDGDGGPDDRELRVRDPDGYPSSSRSPDGEATLALGPPGRVGARDGCPGSYGR
jgi:hypothetical protein